MRATPKTFQRMLILMCLIALAAVSCQRQEQASSLTNKAAQDPQIQPNPVSSATPRKIFKSGEVVPSGYLGYKVHRSWFDSKPSGASSKQSSSHFYIDLSVVNTDKKDRALPPFAIVDEAGVDHQPSKDAWKSQGSLGLVDKLAPATSKRGFVIFEAPEGHTYKLKLQGFKLGDDAFIDLTPEAKPQSSPPN